MDKFLSENIFYRAEGIHSGHTAVMLVHGFAEDGRVWDNQASYLRNSPGNGLLIIPDLPGSGRSARSLPAENLEQLADSLKTLLDREEIEKCILVGHSMGGYVSLAFAEKYPDRLLGLGLFHSTAYPDNGEKKENRKKNIAFIEKNGSAAFVKQATPGLFSENFRKDRPDFISAFTGQYTSFDAVALMAYTKGMMDRPDRSQVLQSLQQPVLFIAGEQDPVIPLQQTLRESHLPERSRIHILPGAAHMGMLEDTDASNSILENFIRSFKDGQ